MVPGAVPFKVVLSVACRGCLGLRCLHPWRAWSSFCEFTPWCVVLPGVLSAPFPTVLTVSHPDAVRGLPEGGSEKQVLQHDSGTLVTNDADPLLGFQLAAGGADLEISYSVG